MAIAHPTRLAPGPVDLRALDTGTTPGFDGDKAAGQAALEHLGRDLSDLQERLFAEGRVGGRPRLLLVLQGMDTSGKGGIVRQTVGLVDPQGVAHRLLPGAHRGGARARLPLADAPGAARAGRPRGLRPLPLRGRAGRAGPRAGGAGGDRAPRTTRSTTSRAELAEDGTTVLKCMLHISAEEQKERLLARLDDPTKFWKYNPERPRRARPVAGDTARAYEIALERTNTEHAPWHVVPATASGTATWRWRSSCTRR